MYPGGGPREDSNDGKPCAEATDEVEPSTKSAKKQVLMAHRPRIASLR
ncbi:hypothetical protein DB32_000528 [Sandaracinus amylolyticus]|uniref:Uncharacterized protein n=1 Tax=Sandaracinus amylolyticus TaxID=927083 RepID=A0A0F6SDG0_9BACT|nr:hypothetical protein DB32_000528 [Sandaracinus amylolyticus]